MHLLVVNDKTTLVSRSEKSIRLLYDHPEFQTALTAKEAGLPHMFRILASAQSEPNVSRRVELRTIPDDAVYLSHFPNPKPRRMLGSNAFSFDLSTEETETLQTGNLDAVEGSASAQILTTCTAMATCAISKQADQTNDVPLVDYISQLPNEVKLQILGYLLVSDNPVKNPITPAAFLSFFNKCPSGPIVPFPKSKLETEIMRVSKSFYKLGLDVLYTENTIAFSEYLVSEKGFHYRLPSNNLRNWLEQHISCFEDDGSRSMAIVPRAQLIRKIQLLSTNADSEAESKAGRGPFHPMGYDLHMPLGHVLSCLAAMSTQRCQLSSLTFNWGEEDRKALATFAVKFYKDPSVPEGLTVQKMTIYGLSPMVDKTTTPVAAKMLSWLAGRNIKAESVEMTGRFSARLEGGYRGYGLTVESFKFHNGKLMLRYIE